MKKIMFNDKYGLTQAVLDGRKTQTRRIIKAKNLFDTDEIEDYTALGNEVQIIANNGESLISIKSKYEVGEVVAVAQSMCDVYAEFDMKYIKKDTKALMMKFGGSACFSNKMFVKASEMPHQIRIINVRIERLQDISWEDCLAEGIIKKWHDPACRNYFYLPNVEVKSTKNIFDSPREAYASLIDKVGKKGDWQSNPYVFVYDFELLK